MTERGLKLRTYRRWQVKVYRKYAGKEPQWHEIFTGPVFLWRALTYIMRERHRRGIYEPLMLINVISGERTSILRDWPHAWDPTAKFCREMTRDGALSRLGVGE